MIKKVHIRNVASYDSKGIELNLSKINYIFGSNGTGKTTISEFLRENNDHKYSSCVIEWEGTQTEILVYNRNFVKENFSVNNDIKGIFTLGKESIDIQEKIDELANQVRKHVDEIDSLNENIKEKQNEYESLRNEFMNQCWKLKEEYDKYFKPAFTGFRNSKVNFMEKCISEAETNTNNLFPFDELIRRVSSIIQGPKDKYEIIPNIKYDISLEKLPIFQTKIIGKNDLDIALLISKLNISDWVKQGSQHLEHTNGVCPFCQQKLPEGFTKQLNEYFDETYYNQLQLLENSIDEYKKATIKLISDCESVTSKNIPFLNLDYLKNILEVIRSVYNENIQILEVKKSEPSRSVTLKTVSTYIEEINSIISQANDQIISHNALLDNLEEEEKNLIKDIWRFIVSENNFNYLNYKNNIEKVTKAIAGMKKSLESKEQYKRKYEQEIIELQNQLTSVLPSINEINSLLKSFGFTNFRLTETAGKGNYKIIRENGEDANETLSEGEKTFITFLYFYQLLNGSIVRNSIVSDRVVVIDDPISSLDSTVLFIVSTLINNIKQRIRDNQTNIKQLLIFTHNVYFHKEVSYSQYGQKQSDEKFWIIRKINNISQVQEYSENPIKNSYELLWRELKDNDDSITAPNIMRRILENYYKFFGNLDVHSLVDFFPEDEKHACRTLLSWVNDGSHYIPDDLYVDNTQEQIDKYFEIFKKIFIYSNHYSHYAMMMGVDDQIMIGDQTIQVKELVLDQAAAAQEQNP